MEILERECALRHTDEREREAQEMKISSVLQRLIIPLSLLLSLVFPSSPLYPSIPSIPFRSSWLEVIHKNKENGDKFKKKHIPARSFFIR